MDEIFLDGKKMTSRKEAHIYIKEMLGLPNYYGENLDALWDILTEKTKIVSIFLLNEEKVYENLGDYGKEIVDLFCQVAAKGNIQFKIIGA